MYLFKRRTNASKCSTTNTSASKCSSVDIKASKCSLIDTKASKCSDSLELDVASNLTLSYESLVRNFEELRIIEAEASEQRASIIKELQQLSASLDALPNRATQIGGERND